MALHLRHRLGRVGGDDELFVTQGPYLRNVGGRTYLMEDDDNYKMFKLLDQEFTFTVSAGASRAASTAPSTSSTSAPATATRSARTT